VGGVRAIYHAKLPSPGRRMKFPFSSCSCVGPWLAWPVEGGAFSPLLPPKKRWPAEKGAPPLLAAADS